MDWSGVDYLWIIVMFLSAVWTLILMAPIHCRASIAETLMQCYISPNLMKKQNSSSSWMAWGWITFQHIFIFGWTTPLTHGQPWDYQGQGMIIYVIQISVLVDKEQMSPEMNLVIANQNIWIMSFLKSEHESKQSQAGWDACESQNLLLLNRHSARTANRQVQMNDWFALAFSSRQEPLMSAITSHCVLQITDLCQIEKFKKIRCLLWILSSQLWRFVWVFCQITQ